MTAPVEITTWPSMDIHTMPGGVPKGKPPFTPQQILAYGAFFIESFVGQVAIAFGGINILGWKPFDFLADWGRDRIAEANANFAAATAAQATADDAATTAVNAMKTITEIKLTIDAGSGDSYADNMDYASAAHLPSPYVLYASGSGAGTYGPNGSSALAWKISGFGSRKNIYSRTDFHSASGKFVAAAVIEARAENDGVFGYIGGVDASGNGAAVAISRTFFVIVELVAGVPTAVSTTTSWPFANGDTYEFYYGSTAEPDALAIRRNGDLIATTPSGGGMLATLGVTMNGPDFYPLIGGSAIGSGLTQIRCGRIASLVFADNNL